MTMDIIRISRAAIARDGMAKQAEETTMASQSLVRVAEAAMAKKADAGSTWSYGSGTSGVPQKRPIGVMAPPRPKPNVNIPKAQNPGLAGAQMNPYESHMTAQKTLRESHLNNQAGVQAANEMANNNKGMNATVDGNGYWQGGVYHNNNGAQSARRARRGLTGWWDRTVSRLGGANSSLAKEVRRGNAIDTRSGWRQFWNMGANDYGNYYQVKAMGQYRAPNGTEYQTSQYNKQQGDLPNQTGTMNRDLKGRVNVTRADVDYDNQMRAKSLMDYYKLGDSDAMKLQMQGLLRDISDSKYQDGMRDDDERWTKAALNKFRSDPRFQAAYSEFRKRNKHMDDSAFLDSIMAEGGQGLSFN